LKLCNCDDIVFLEASDVYGTASNILRDKTCVYLPQQKMLDIRLQNV